MQICIGGTPYELEFNMWALERIEDQWGGLDGMYKAIGGKKRLVWTMTELLTIFINAKRVKDNMPMIDHEFVSTNLAPKDLMNLQNTVHEALGDGISSALKDTDFDDDAHDVVLEEIEKKGLAE